MRTFFVVGLSALVIGGPALAQGTGQSSPGQQSPSQQSGQRSPGQQTIRPPQSVAGKPESQPGKPAASTPESRSAAELALSADPVFDDGTYLRVKQTLLSYSAVEVRGGWPMLPTDAKLAPGASGAAVTLLRRYLVITGDLPANAETGDSYDDAVTGVQR